ncbi:MAG: hypothetical protein HYT72_00240 [Candidatus Aenigmarchaeota archaeon]|nr:hypothetical protein [Candidatus Aenigmarchaeota archaeon]
MQDLGDDDLSTAYKRMLQNNLLAASVNLYNYFGDTRTRAQVMRYLENVDLFDNVRVV